MENDYPRIAQDKGDELVFEKCACCESDAMMAFEDGGLCGMHYAEAMGWLEKVVDKDANPESAEVFDEEAVAHATV